MMARRWLISGLLTVAAFAQMHAAVAQSTSPPFPHLGAYLISGSVQQSFGTASFQQQVAKLNAVVIGLYPGWSSGGFSLSSLGTALKSYNPNMKITLYTNAMEFESGVGTSGSAYSPEFISVTGANWFLRSGWPSGSIELDSGSYQEINITSPHTYNGKTYRQQRAAWSAANEFTTPWDGVYLDNFGLQPSSNGDFLENGTTQSGSAAASLWQTSYANYVSQLNSALPAGAQVWGNTATWGNGSLSNYNQVLNGGVIEHFIGQSFSYESQGWTVMMNTYGSIMKATIAPGYQIFSQDDASATDYQGMRYGLASCLLDNGYYYFNTNSYNAVNWFDEFNASLGAPASGPAGAATATYSNGGLKVWQNGVWRRDFTNGIALVNPKGNGPQTVTLETTYTHLSGTQAPTINNGQSVTSVTLQDRDGLILLRAAAQAVPDPPSLTVQ
jgi:hypothetical protein